MCAVVHTARVVASGLFFEQGDTVDCTVTPINDKPLTSPLYVPTARYDAKHTNQL